MQSVARYVQGLKGTMQGALCLVIKRGMMADDKKAKKEELKADAKAAPEGGAEGDAGDEGGKKFGAKKIVLFAVLPILLLGGGGAAAYFTGMLDKFLPAHEVDCTTVQAGDPDFEMCAEKLAAEQGANAPGVFIDIPGMIVNLNSTSKQPRFLKILLKIELEKKEDQVPFETLLPRVVDQFQTYLRELRIEDLRGSSGMYRMKIELLSRVRAAAPEIKVRDVLFQEILVQ